MLTESVEALQGHKGNFSATSARVGDSSESLYWCNDSRLDFKQFVETISVLYYPYLHSASEGPLQENRFYQTVLYRHIGKPEIFWYILLFGCYFIGFEVDFSIIQVSLF